MVEKIGVVRIIRDGKLLASPFLSIQGKVSGGSEQGLLSLAFDPRYRDFPFAPLSAAALPFVILSVAAGTPEGERGLAETVMAAALAGSAAYVAINEGFANWQSLWLCAVFLAIALTLFRARDAQNSE